ncbi:PURPLE ACID PHOSPHATASE-RELATED [Salix koriyanagi]|uniref:Purple acid phosphatase n=1 Tax=Salix koriyanagi TaxID=2511006 RepID=A0A9Q0Q9I9_9ROSI|nr:PURPLE ACID PHOSPHATASE-RELATED [Salix koriyanagi]
MKPSTSSSPAVLDLFLILLAFFPFSSSYMLPPSIVGSTIEHRNHTAISSFRVVNRRNLIQCPDANPYLRINVSSENSPLSHDEFVNVTVSGVFHPSDGDWVAMISPSDSNVRICLLNKIQYAQTGDLSELPLLCHYPVKAQYVSNDPNYLECNKQERKKYNNTASEVATCSGTVSFHVINIRTDIEFVFFAGGFETPCILTRSGPMKFSNPNQPLHGHVSSTDSAATSMRLTWVSGSKKPQEVRYGDGRTLTSTTTTFSRDDMCTSILPSPAKDFGWHDPGFIHSAVMTGLRPSTAYSYRYGSDSVGWSDKIQFRTPPAGGSDELKFLAFGDMGKAPLDPSAEHYIQPGSLSVIKAMTEESSGLSGVLHDRNRKPRERLHKFWICVRTPDSGGECGVAYETYFPMPTSAKDKPWYSIEQGPVHFTVISTEHDWAENSEQYKWMERDISSVDRSKTPWLVFAGHRPMYSSTDSLFGTDDKFTKAVEPLLVQYKVDMVLCGHVHNYERTCSVYDSNCLAMPSKDRNGIDTYDHSNFSAPLHAVIGMAGFSLDNFSQPRRWSLVRISEFGYLRGHATMEDINLEFVNSNTRQVQDSFRITKGQK